MSLPKHELLEVTEEIKLAGVKITDDLNQTQTGVQHIATYSTLWMLKRIKNL